MMSHVRLILAVHNHQPVGQCEGILENSYRTSYLPFLEVLESYPELPFVVHTSGPLLEWLVDRHADYIARVRALVEAGRIEVLGGGFHEPILTMIPLRDRVGQIREFTEYLQDLFPKPIRGIWLAEGVWEQHLVSAIADAGIAYTVLDDDHFVRAGCAPDDVFGYYLTEYDGRLLKVFAAAGTLRPSIPLAEPQATFEYLRWVAQTRPGSTVVLAVEGEKLRAGPGILDHVETHGWLERFCEMIVANRGWIEPTTMARVVDTTLPRGKVFLPEGSYRETADRALVVEALAKGVKRLVERPQSGQLERLFRPGGSWCNFKARYPESDEMYARMLGISKRLAAARENPDADPDYLDVARRELYRGQCHCAYWDGSSGGIYRPRLRNAVYQGLINAHNALDDALGLAGPRVDLEVGDFNLDARREVRLENDHLIAWVRPARGGQIYELDVRGTATNLLATFDRQPEADDAPGRDAYDRPGLKALVDHFYPIDLTLEDLIAGRETELGDFANGTFLAKTRREPGRVALAMERPGIAGRHAIRVRKTIELSAGDNGLSVHYELDELPAGVCLHFAVELNLAALSGHAPDCAYSDPAGEPLGMLDCRLDLLHTRGLALSDGSLDLVLRLSWSKSTSLWCFPVETASRGEGGLEALYQSSTVIPHWHVTADEKGHWDVWIRSSVDRAAAPKPLADRHSRLTVVPS
jgi:alpha-amylase